ncbi:ABC transporter [Microbacterium oryzae]|uniref:ABC transporter n=1 Tax=Microbacterium oryzae TaxID=743009 RepID=UPI0025B0A5FC|nr:ABC transporter [Microbacterium oryzae]MDN3311248.1 ABC transporter [Microbacterium oryzae]
MRLRRPLLALSAAAVLLLASCASPDAAEVAASPAATEEASGSDSGHGAVAGAAEVAEPPLQLVSVDAGGGLGILDLLDGSTTELATIGAPESTATDGRYVFATTDDGLEIVDSGVWTWDHVDHFHYYRSEPSLVGTLEGEGQVVVTTGPLATAGGTGVFFSGSGDAVLLDNDALSNGEIVESFRIETGADQGLVAPLGTGALVSVSDDTGRIQSLRFHDVDGTASGSADIGCVDAEGAMVSRVGLVVGCADGALLATMDGGEPVFERIAYPESSAERATAFDGRKGRPTVAALAGGSGFWLLDTRERAWQLVETGERLLRVSAVDDADGHVVGLHEDGSVRVYLAETGEEIAATESLLPETLEDAALLEHVSVFVDAQRAYVNAPAEGVVYEIAYADGARIARTLETPTEPVHLAEVGR